MTTSSILIGSVGLTKLGYPHRTKSNILGLTDHFIFLILSWSVIFTEIDKFHCVNSVCIRSHSGQHFPAFGLNTERYGVYGVSLRVQSEYEKMRTRITPNTDTFYAGFHSLDTGRKSNVYGAFKRRPKLLLNILRAFNVCPISCILFHKN